MIVFPAIDLRHGRCVRLTQGDPNQETVFGEDPLPVAHRWRSEGASWLHVVNLDGALGNNDQSGVNLSVVTDIVTRVGLPVQFGGGLRSFEDVDRVLSLGVQRVVIGTAAISDPQMVERCVRVFGPGRIALALDAREGRVATHGWQTVSHVAPISLARQMGALGVEWVIYTDISRDGMLSGVNVAATAALGRETGLHVIASGGVASIEDIHRLKAVEADGVHGVIIGKALYTEEIDLGEALAVASRTQGLSLVAGEG
jgi:phosphoribosylformimino-5-aminoimidazole carboxamide ribotide isomerase